VVLERAVDGVEELSAHEKFPRVDPFALHELDLAVDEPRSGAQAECGSERRRTCALEELRPAGVDGHFASGRNHSGYASKAQKSIGCGVVEAVYFNKKKYGCYALL
jgi:hypothetical protein